MPRKILRLPELPRATHRLSALLQNDDPLSVALVGCGGNGAQMLTKLARLHHALRECGKAGLSLHVFDPDTVSRANVGRQLFSQSDVGAHKSAVLANRINAYYGLDWQSHTVRYPGFLPGHWQGSQMAPDILITCVDTAKARREIFKNFSKTVCGGPRYWLDLGNMKLAGQVVLGEPAECKASRAWIGNSSDFEKGQRTDYARLPHVVDLFPEILNTRRKEDDAPTCSLAEALDRQSLFINDAISTYAAQLLDDLLRIGEIAAHGYFVNMETGRTTALPVPAECAAATAQKKRRAA